MPPIPKISEKAVERYLVLECRSRGWICWKFSSPNKRGVPDRLVVSPGGVFFVEVKGPTGRLTKLQNKTIEDLLRQRADVWVVRNREEVQSLIREIENRVILSA